MAKNNDEKASPEYENDIFEDVVKYYQNSSLKSDKHPEPEKREREYFEFGFNIDDVLNEEIFEQKQTSKMDAPIFFLGTFLLALAVVASSYNIALSLNSDAEKISGLTEDLKKSDEEYVNAVNEQERLDAIVSALTTQNLDIQEKKGVINAYSDTKSALEKKVSELSQQETQLREKVENKRGEISELQSNSNVYTLTLNPGVYTVGKNIPAAVFEVSGKGSIIASTSAKEMKVNEQLSESAPMVVKLLDGYTVKINKKTVFKISTEK